MKTNIRLWRLMAGLACVPLPVHAELQAVEKVETYAIAGRSGAELYASIGARGPGVGNSGRAIAYTTFKLTWSRKYEREGNACVLVSAQPKLIVTTILPKPPAALPVAVRNSWDVFLAGVRKHEQVHGAAIKEMVAEIEAVSVGLTVADDSKCRKIRAELTRHLGAISSRQRQGSRDFDRTELSPGGNVHQLVLQLVNGP